MCPAMKMLSGPDAKHVDFKDMNFDSAAMRANLESYSVSAYSAEQIIQNPLGNPAPLPARIFSSLV